MSETGEFAATGNSSLPPELERVHMVGIGGAGMSGIARILLSRTTFPQRACSATMNFCRSAGVLTTRSMPSIPESCLRTSGRLKILTSSA